MGQMSSRLTGEDVLILLGPVPGRGVRAWLHRGLREGIRSGVVPVDSVLPSSRQAALSLGVSRGTVSAAFDLLVAEGVVSSRPRSGLVVPPSVTGPVPQTAPPTRTAPASPGTPDPALFPYAGWTRSLRQAMVELGPAHLGYQDPQGLPVLREALADHLRRTRGVVAEADDICVVNGVAQAQSLLAGVLRARGRSVVAVEDPGSPGARELLTASGMTVVSVPVDDEGARPADIPDGAAAVVVTPTHQFPTGGALGTARRRELIGWAGDTRWVIEDDYDAELRYDRQPVPALQALSPESVILVGSVSKTLAPSLRLGWIVVPKHLRQQLIAAKRYADLGTSVVDQLAFAHFLGSGAYQRHVRSVRLVYQHRRRELVAALTSELPGVRILGLDAGLHVVLELSNSRQESAVVEGLVAAGISCHGYSATFEGLGRPGVVLGTARTGVEAAAIVREVLQRHP